VPDHDVESSSTTDGLPVAPALGPTLLAARVPVESRPVDRRVLFICGVAVAIAVAAGLVAQLLSALISVLTNVSFFGRVTTAAASPADNHLGAWVVLVPVAGAVVVGFLARYGSKAIRGHGIPEAMEQILTNESRIPPRITWLKPVSAAVAIGTGGPFGAEGPIIATGGALGSLVGQLLRTTAMERRTLLAAGAAAGMAATFGSPAAAVLLAIELLLFEFRAASFVPVALAACAATAVRIAFVGTAPVFAMPDIAEPGALALTAYVLLGALAAVAAVGVTRIVYFLEDCFEKLPIHWMWWPALGGIVVGVVGFVSPRTLGVGYSNIEDFLAAHSALTVVAALCAWKFVSWAVALSSGTSGGTLAPLLTIGGGFGAVVGTGLAIALPGAGIDVRVAALVGMAAMFAGASRATLTSVVFAFEVTRQPIGLLPLLGGCAASYLISSLLMRHSIMTEKIARRGVRVASEYTADWLDQVTVRDHASRDVVTIRADQTVEEAREWILAGGEGRSHQGFPVVDADGRLVGVVTRRDLFGNATDRSLPLRRVLRRAPAVIYEDRSLREAADHMVREGVGRLPVVRRDDPTRVVGILTRSDLLDAHRRRIDESSRRARAIEFATAGAAG
jgi:H+/Cl- antiporter ClcA/CBS domain-containing protein